MAGSPTKATEIHCPSPVVEGSGWGLSITQVWVHAVGWLVLEDYILVKERGTGNARGGLLSKGSTVLVLYKGGLYSGP